MKKILSLLALLIIITPNMNAQSQKMGSEKMLRHVVMFKFKDDSSPADVKKVEDAFRALPSKIKEIKDFEWGTNNSPENLNQDYTHVFFVSFASDSDRAVYLPHPAHQAFVEVLKPHLDKVMVMDYYAGK